MRAGKKGLSPVIASVFLILLVIAVTSLIFSWARGFADEKGSEIGSSISDDALCDSVELRVVAISSTDFEAMNKGNVNVSYLKFKVFDSEGNSKIVNSAGEIPAGEAIVLSGVAVGNSVYRIEALSVLDKGSSEIVCTKDPVHVEGV